MRIAIFAVLLAAGTSARAIDIPSSPGTTPAVATDGERVFAVWGEVIGEQSRVRGTIVGSDETVDVALHYLPQRLTVVYGGGQFLTGWADGRAIYGLRFSTDGSLIDHEPITIATSSSGYLGTFAVTPTEWGFVFVWDVANDGLYQRSVRFESVVTPARRILDTTGYSAASVALSWNGWRFLYGGEYFPYSLFPTLGPVSMIGRIFDRDGNVVGDPAAISGANGWTASNARIASDGRDFLVVTSGTDVTYATFVSSDGVSAAPRVVFRWRPDLSVSHDVAWNGQQYVIALRYSVPIAGGKSASFIGAVRIDSSGSSRMDVLRWPFGVGVSVAASAPDHAWIATSHFLPDGNGTISVNNIADFGPAPAPPDAPQNVSVNAYGKQTILRWDDRSSNEEGFLAGWLFREVASLPPDALAASVETVTNDPAIYFVNAWNAGGCSPPAFATVDAPNRQRAIRH